MMIIRMIRYFLWWLEVIKRLESIEHNRLGKLLAYSFDNNFNYCAYERKRKKYNGDLKKIKDKFKKLKSKKWEEVLG